MPVQQPLRATDVAANSRRRYRLATPAAVAATPSHVQSPSRDIYSLTAASQGSKMATLEEQKKLLVPFVQVWPAPPPAALHHPAGWPCHPTATARPCCRCRWAQRP